MILRAVIVIVLFLVLIAAIVFLFRNGISDD